MKKVLISFILLISLASCQKMSDTSILQPSIQKSEFKTMTEIFSKIDKRQLENIISTNNEAIANQFLLEKANEITIFFFEKYHIDLSKEFPDDPRNKILVGLFYCAKERYNNEGLKNTSVKQDGEITKAILSAPELDCFITAVSAIVGISDAKNLWKGIIAGASEETAIAAVKLIGKRVASAVTLTLAIYEIGDCLDWW